MRLKTAETVVNLPIHLIDESPFNPRKQSDPAKLQELASTITSVEVVQPVIVRKNPADENRFQLVFGSRRLEGSKLAGKTTIPAIVRELTDEQILSIQFIENEQREDLPPLDQARGYAALMEKNPTLYTVEELSARLGKRDSRYVAERLQLLHLIAAAQLLLEHERLPYRHAFEISRLTPDQQGSALHVCFTNFDSAEGVISRPYQTVSISLDGLRQWITTHCHLDLNQAPFPLDQPLAGAVACIECPKRAGAGTGVLFADIAQENTCLDPDCFQRKKEETLVQITVQQAQETGVQTVRISNSLRVGAAGESPDVLYRGEYRTVERDSCEYAERGVPEEKDQAQVYICRQESCPVHAGKTRYASPTQKEDRKKKVRDQREEKQFRVGLLTAVKDKVSKTPQKADLYLVACRMLQLLSHENRIALFRLFKWIEQKSAGQRGGKHVDYVELGKVQLNKLGVFELQQFLIVASLTPDLIIPDAKPEQTLPANSNLALTAKRMRIDAKTIRTKARKAVKEPAKAAKAS